MAAMPSQSGRPASLTMPWATSTRKPSTPRSSQKRSTERISSQTSGFSQLRSGCFVSKRCRYQSPGEPSALVVRVQAGPPKMDFQLFGAAFPSPEPATRPSPAGTCSAPWRPSPVCCEGLLEPHMLIGRVIGNQVDDHLQPAAVGLVKHGVEVGQCTERRVHLPVIGDVIAAVGLRGPVERREPDGVDAELLAGRAGVRDAGQVTHAVTVPIRKRTGINLVDNRVGPPRCCSEAGRLIGLWVIVASRVTIRCKRLHTLRATLLV